MKTAKPLPDKASDLLDLAVTDAIRASKRKGFRLDMLDWVVSRKLESGSNRGKRVCTVCMAGAVMTQTMGLRPEKDDEIFPSDTGEERKLAQINHMRLGDMYDVFASTLDQARAKEQAGALIRQHMNHATGRAPWRVYRKAAQILREADL